MMHCFLCGRLTLHSTTPPMPLCDCDHIRDLVKIAVEELPQPFLAPDVSRAIGADVVVDHTRIWHMLRDLVDAGELQHTDKGYVRLVAA